MGRICKETGSERAGCKDADGEYGVVDGGCDGCIQLQDDEDAASLRAEVERLTACNEAMREPMRVLRELVGMPAEGEAAVVDAVRSEVEKLRGERDAVKAEVDGAAKALDAAKVPSGVAFSCVFPIGSIPLSLGSRIEWLADMASDRADLAKELTEARAALASSRRTALEEAAGIADAKGDERTQYDEYWDACLDIALAIRAAAKEER